MTSSEELEEVRKLIQADLKTNREKNKAELEKHRNIFSRIILKMTIRRLMKK